jgi:hypothetical protein
MQSITRQIHFFGPFSNASFVVQHSFLFWPPVAQSGSRFPGFSRRFSEMMGEFQGCTYVFT